ncbi:acyl-CoA dehydrogenase NM domain-like protein [Eremomyces bilateralis CBS 781.70]|uniref:Acyl-CoA dehydrogenase NM domain-like protein n=1 Tax=Eremomyces bilateralis CBS 781.70 TaxID=1392243 RepID=A0A6G1G8H9_9PEZI|nr:acyl-CoA dehydrogenase NM domain-like protein [Eremomyces bilateralis CBS 781.70]KAF1814344.1 acyl-CoA dehydrogenase NM domain-like protein [Eremomyces bilateralis CBS 781.70]
MSADIPPLVADRVSQKARDTLDLVKKFVEEECMPADAVARAQMEKQGQRWGVYPPVIDDLKAKAKKLGLWNIFLSKTHYAEGAGLTNLEYGLIAMILGKSSLASEAVNCAAPDTGNMEVLAKYGTDAQKKQWLAPLLDGTIRSAFLMTEPKVASSDAKNISLKMERQGNEYVLNGQKWWSSGAGDPRCKIYIVLGKTNPNAASAWEQHSVILVPAGTPGVKIERYLSVYGYDDAPHGHAEITFDNVRVPASSLVLGEGRGFEIIQGRLGPGRIHHAMRSLGSAERALELMIARVNDPNRKTFGKQLNQHGVIMEWIARSRMEIDAARLVVLNASIKIDETDAKGAQREIAAAKVMVPAMALQVIDRAVQSHGAAGVSQDTPLASMWAHMRTVRIADGPDEVHLQQMGRNENKRNQAILGKFEQQRERVRQKLREYGFEPKL